MIDSVIKFNCEHVLAVPIEDSNLKEIMKARNELFGLGLIGAYADGDGFGNISVRIGDSNKFIISASGTGAIKDLEADGFSEVVDYDFDKNWLKCVGPKKASSESLSHAAVYGLRRDVSAIVHVHNFRLWNELKGVYPTTSFSVEYGTPEMAFELMKASLDSNVVIMGGHEEGLMVFGADLQECLNNLKKVMGWLMGEDADPARYITTAQ